ncbi:MAG: ATP-binding protein [Muribaculaceae bacterium]|nr:ATP-binding protein [Muribaculaceae bacterium]
MLQSFYKYIAKELLFGYFKNNPLKKGSRYYMIVENEDHRNGLMDAINELCENISISGIYQGNNVSVKEESYDTYVLNYSDNHPSIIIGYDKTSTEDYLTTIRNSVGVVGGKYENYGVIYILSDSTLSSIITACQDLQSLGGPLHSSYIINDIKQKAEDLISKDLERAYLDWHLDKIKDYIEDGTCNLFDFEHALNVLADKTLKGHYNELDFFNDKRVYDGTFKPTDSELRDRVDKNHDIYRKVCDVMNEDDDVDKLKLLQKFLDEKLSRKIVSNDNWKDIDFQEFIESIDRKAATANLELLYINLSNKGLMTSMVDHRKGNPKKKTNNYIVVCDQSGSISQEVKITFNKEIKKIKTDEIQVQGQNLKVLVGDSVIKQSVGINDNHHDFYMMKLPCSAAFFKDIKNCFSISKKGEIVVVVPDETDVLTFGNGSDLLSIPLDNKVVWSDNARLEVPVVSDNDNDIIDFNVDFGGKEVHIILKLHIANPDPPARPGTIEGTYDGETVTVDGKPRPIYSYWKQYLDWEKAFIDNKCTHINCVLNSLTNQREPEFEHLALPVTIKVALEDIYMYFRRHNTVPSLCHINEELRMLYKKYWNTIVEVICNIPTNRSLTKEEYFISKLGVVSDWNRIYLSPFHPINIAYSLEYDKQYDDKEESSFAKKLLSPFYLLPYIFIDSSAQRPYTDKNLSEVQNWLSYEGINSKPQERTNDITTKMVWSKMEAFIKHFTYLFQDKDCPIIISTIGITDDTNVIKGIVEFIKHTYARGVQRIEVHEYVDNLMDETFFEKLNRLDSIDAISRELESLHLKIESKGDYTSQEIIHQLFTRVAFYKHHLDDVNGNVGYSHIAFYQMDTGTEFIRQVTSELRTELSFNGLISIPSTYHKDGAYIIGYGTNGLDEQEGFIYPMVSAMNTLYANEEHDGSSVFSRDTCVAKRYKFSKSNLLNSIYDNANWVTFINPEVDINFFYKQNLYVVHYTDQYTINAKYDSITVTKHVDQYENMLRKSYEKYALSEERFLHFNETMMNYFNCLNGSWMLDVVNKTEDQIREKMSIVAASIAMLHFMRRNDNVLWVPVSLEEILRVTGSIGLPQEYIFTKKNLGVKGAMSDDLLMIGLDPTNKDDLQLYLYPVEVKFSKNSSMADKAGKQVSQTFTQLKEHLFGDTNFTKNIYRTFFASQFLTNAEKLNANSLLSDDLYNEIEKYRYDLLNLKYTLNSKLPVKEMGSAAIISFYSHASHSMSTSLVDNVPVCEVHFSEQECFQFVSDPNSNLLDFLKSDAILVDSDTLNAIDNPVELTTDDDNNTNIELSTIDEEEEDAEQKPELIAAKTPQTSETKTVPAENNQEQHSIRIVLGNTLSGNREIVFEPNNTKMVSHPNMGIIGTMGTGKTQLARSIIAQFSKEGAHNVGGKNVGMLVFDYKGDYKDQKFLDAVGGFVYKNKLPFNPLKLIVNEDVLDMNLPAITADRISDSLAKAYGLGLKQQNNIKQTIVDAYAESGITEDSSTWSNNPPTMNQVISMYLETYDSNDKAFALLSNLRDYNVFTKDNDNCVSILEWLDSVRVFDLTIYSDEAKRVVVSLLLDLFFAEMKQLGESKQENGFRELRAMILVDEAREFMSKDFNSLRGIISQGRMFGVGMILATQYVSDFRTQKEDYSQSILSWMIHHVNSISKSEIASIFGASDPNGDRYMDFINKAKLFESVCKIGSKVEGVRDLPFFELVDKDERFKPKDDNQNEASN